ncbi:MAG TPA: hypothetical protein VNT51_09390 [Miltoncostaeaceae bacterium]|nr:hypothetical protein [Miltoncostaeaceae bacterium]
MDMSLAEAVLQGYAEDAGVEPEDDLLARLEKTPPPALRRLRRLDAEILELCGVAPLALGHGLVTLLETGVTDDGLVDRDGAWDQVGAAAQGDPEEPEVTQARLLELAHRVLGLPAGCTDCRDALSQAGVEGEEEDEEGDPHAHAEGPDLLGAVYDTHAADLDTWEHQVARRIAEEAADALAEVGGFELLHELMGHAQVPGMGGDRRAQAHAAQHVGFGICLGAAGVQGVRAALGGLGIAGGVAARMEEAERRAAEEGAVLGTVIASVVVDETAQRVVAALDAAPPSGPPSGPARARRRRR